MGFQSSLSHHIHTSFFNKMLNSAFKKQEILRPAKLPHHEIKLVQRPGLSGDCFNVVADGVRTSAVLSTHADTGARDDKEFRHAQFHLAMHVMWRKPRPDGGIIVIGVSVIHSTTVKGDRLEEYHNHVMRTFFDIVHSVRDPSIMKERYHSWFEHVQRCEQRNKWV
jgi:hypothetical protein